MEGLIKLDSSDPNYNEVIDKQLEFLKYFENVEVKHPMFDVLHKAWEEGKEEDIAKIYEDPNICLLYQCLGWATVFDKEEKYKKSFINLLKILLVLYATNGYVRSRLGWFCWCMVCGANPNSHYPLTWEGCMEPAKWYYAGEMQRKDEYRVNSEGGDFSLAELK